MLYNSLRNHHLQNDIFLIKSLTQVKVPVFLVINKIDLIDKKLLLPLIDKFRQLYDYREIFPVSAMKGDGIARRAG